MEQGRKAAQVATKYIISDLWKDAMAHDALSSPSLLPPTITINRVNHDVATLQYLVRHLSEAARKSLLAQFKPLSQDLLLEPTNILAYWQQVESAVESLDISFMGVVSDPFMFTSSHI